MRYEMSLVRADFEGVEPLPRTALRAQLRQATDALIHDALLENNLPALVQLCGSTMLTVASTLVQVRQEPDVPDLVEAAQGLIEDARNVLDRGLMLDVPETTKIGAVMVELIARGLCAVCSVDYDKLLAYLYAQRVAGAEPDPEAIRRFVNHTAQGADNETANT